MEASTKDLRLHARVLLAATDRGEEVFITWRGRRRAKLVRWNESDTPSKPRRAGRNPAFGLWSDRSEEVDQQVRELRKPRKRP